MYFPYIHFTFCLHWLDVSQLLRNVNPKACFFLAYKVVKCLTFVTHPSGQLHQAIMFTGDSQFGQRTNVILLFLKSSNCIGDIYLLLNN